MADNYYEGMFILDSGKFGADPDGAAQEILGILGKIDATVSTHRPWQDTKLQYQINGHRKGLYYLTFFTADTSRVNELNRIVQLNDNVIRHMVIRHPKSLFDQMVGMIGGDGAFRHESEEAPAESAEKPSADKPAAEEAPASEPAAAE